MTLDLHPLKVMRLFSPLWLLLAPSLWLYWAEWLQKPILLAFVAGLPVAGAIGAGFARQRWRLELTPEALIHRTLGRTERLEWARMGPVTLKPAMLSHLLFVRTLWFEYPVDEPRNVEERLTKATGKRLLCVFGDGAPNDAAETIEQWRAMYAKR